MKRIKLDPNNIDLGLIAEAGRALLDGALVAFPTETVYGVGVGPDQPAALDWLFDLKGRSDDKPLTLHLADREEFDLYTLETSTGLKNLLDEFWPGPLNVVVNVRESMPLSRGRMWEQAGFRLPDCPIARALASHSESVIFATSANISGNPAPRDADTVEKEFGGGVDIILDAGPCPGGIASTVVRVTGGTLELLRPGAIPAGHLQKIFQKKC